MNNLSYTNIRHLLFNLRPTIYKAVFRELGYSITKEDRSSMSALSYYENSLLEIWKSKQDKLLVLMRDRDVL